MPRLESPSTRAQPGPSVATDGTPRGARPPRSSRLRYPRSALVPCVNTPHASVVARISAVIRASASPTPQLRSAPTQNSLRLSMEMTRGELLIDLPPLRSVLSYVMSHILDWRSGDERCAERHRMGAGHRPRLHARP